VACSFGIVRPASRDGLVDPPEYSQSVTSLDPGRKRRHLPLFARALWGVALGFGLAMAVTGLIAWLN
jgi:hypothetical protein